MKKITSNIKLNGERLDAFPYFYSTLYWSSRQGNQARKEIKDIQTGMCYKLNYVFQKDMLKS